MKSYDRVLPRDLFNEGLLLKCLGKVSLAIHNGLLPILTVSHLTDETLGFDIRLSPCGHLYCSNLKFECNHRDILFATPVNSRDSWPLLWGFDFESLYNEVFDGGGDLDKDFVLHFSTVLER